MIFRIGFFFSVLVHRNGCHIIKHKLRPAGDITYKCTEIVYYFGKCCRWNMRSWQSSLTQKKLNETKMVFEIFLGKKMYTRKYYLNVNSCFAWNIERRKCKRTNAKKNARNGSFITQHQNDSSCTECMPLYCNSLFIFCENSFGMVNCKLLSVFIK